MSDLRILQSGIRDIRAGKNVTIVAAVNLYGCRIGDDCFIGPFLEIQPNASVGNRWCGQSHALTCELARIGDDCFISHEVMFINNLFARGARAGGPKPLAGDHVSTGTNSTFLPVRICSHVVIGAGAMATKPVMQSGIYTGNPAKLIRRL
jgi:acetyltransferase-like isoleucine patch superfamily enzyme